LSSMADPVGDDATIATAGVEGDQSLANSVVVRRHVRILSWCIVCALIIGVVLGFGVCIWFCTCVKDTVESTALVVYENPGYAMTWSVGGSQAAISLWSWFRRFVMPHFYKLVFCLHEFVCARVDGASSLWFRAWELYQWVFLARCAVLLGISELTVLKGIEVLPPFEVKHSVQFVESAVECFKAHNTRTIAARNLATVAPHGLGAFWSIDGVGANVKLRLIGFGLVGDGVVTTMRHVVDGNGGVVHCLKLGFRVGFSLAHLQVRDSAALVPLPKAMCESLVSGRSSHWFAHPPTRKGESGCRPCDDHCQLRFPNVNSLLGVKAKRQVYLQGKASFTPITAFEYHYDDDEGCYLLYKQVGVVYGSQPSPGLLGLSITSKPGMSGSPLFDPVNHGIVGFVIGCTEDDSGDVLSLGVCIRQVMVYWTLVEAMKNKSCFSWPVGRPTIDSHTYGSPMEEQYWLIDSYEREFDDGDFEAGDWETLEEKRKREHRERDEAVIVQYGEAHIDYTSRNGVVVMHANSSSQTDEPSDTCGVCVPDPCDVPVPDMKTFRKGLQRLKQHAAAPPIPRTVQSAQPESRGSKQLLDTGRLQGFSSVDPLASGILPEFCYLCGNTNNGGFCARCVRLLNTQYTRWEENPSVPCDLMPLSPFEQSLVNTLELQDPVAFCKDAAGNDFLFTVGKSKVEKRYNPCNMPEPDPEILKAIGVTEKFYPPVTDESGVLSSMIANVEKRKVGNFGESQHHWELLLLPTASDYVRFPVDVPALPGPGHLLARVKSEVFKLAQAMKMDRAAGWSGLLTNCGLKGDLMAKYGEEVVDTAARRICRFLTHHEFSTKLTPFDLVRYGFRGAVVPDIKREHHPARKVIGQDGKRLEHPRWRSILVQDTCDHLVHTYFEESFNKALVANYQEGNVSSVLSYGSLIGLGTHAAGLERIHEILKAVASDHECIVTSDVSGMDWCLGTGDVMAAAAVRAQHTLRGGSYSAERFTYASYAASLSEAKALYLIGKTFYAANEPSVCQTGSPSTSEIDTFARNADARVRSMGCTPLSYGDDSARADWLPGGVIPYPNYISALDERDISRPLDYLGGDTLNICSRDFNAMCTDQFQLTSWRRGVTKLTSMTSPAEFALSAGGLLVECRYTPEAIDAIKLVAAMKGFPDPVPASNFNVDDYL